MNLQYNKNRKPELRLMYLLGWMFRFFSFDPYYVICQDCGFRKAKYFNEVEVDGGARRNQINNYCKPCNAQRNQQ